MAANAVLQQNNTFEDITTFFMDTDPSSNGAFRFECSGIDNGATRVITIPNTDATLGVATSLAADNITEGDAAVTIKTSSGAINIGHADYDEAINIGSGGTGIITIGHDTSTKVDVNAQIIELDSVGTMTLSSGGILAIDTVGTDAINIGTEAAAKTITIGNDASTKVDINALAIELDSAAAMTLSSVGAIGMDTVGTAAINIGTEAAAKTITIGNDASTAVTLNAAEINLNGDNDVNLNSTSGSIDINVVDGQTVSVGLNGGVETVWSPSGTTGSELWSTINTSGTTDGDINAGAILLKATAGGIGLVWNDSKNLVASGGKTQIYANQDIANCILLNATSGGNQTISIANEEGTAAGAINLTATLGGITLSGPKKGTNVDGTYFFAISNDTNQTTPVLYSFSAVAQKAYYIEVHVCCYNTTDNTSFSYIVKSLIQRDAANNTAVIGTNSAETRGTLDGNTVTVVTDDTNEEIDVVLTPASTDELKWRGTIKIISNDTPTSTAE